MKLTSKPPTADERRCAQAQALELAARITAHMDAASRSGRRISPVQALAELEESTAQDEMTLVRRLAARIGAHIEAAARQGRQITSAQAAIELGIKPGEVLQARHQRRG
ncbi:MAG: hypothetical protein KIT17_03820 [Rubrivivax sp.]|nr:hypothetical protein [Rubrivivax sp.]